MYFHEKASTISLCLNVQGEFGWDSSMQGLIIMSTDIVGFIMPLMTDALSRKMGAKMLYFICIAINCVCTLLVPVGARLSPFVLVALRMVGGFASVSSFFS